ncbi:cytochrome p450 714a1 [Quercus suber]|uniref:Cytochrome p450 714a1 n=2 Tax=Quercus suber TaxID=58331 RepID=A0AAW0KFG9_QUESU
MAAQQFFLFCSLTSSLEEIRGPENDRGICNVLIRVCHEVWLKPRQIQSMLWRQGIRGPQPSFPYGNISEIQKIQSSMINNTSDGQPVSENWTHSLFPYLQQWRQEYGPAYMYSTGSKQHLYVSDPELLRELRLKSLNNSLDLGRSSYRGRPFQPLVGDGIIGANGSNWAYQRKLIAPKFFLNKVKNMVGVIELSTIAMMKTWENHIIESEGGVTDMIIDEDLKSLSADIISRACFGSSYSQGNQIFSKITSLQYALSKQSVLLGLFNFRFSHPITLTENKSFFLSPKDIIRIHQDKFISSHEVQQIDMKIESFAKMEQGLVAEIWWSLVVIGACSVLIRVCHEVWLKLRRIRSVLWRQGIRGPQPSFPYGNISEMQKIQSSMINNTSDGQPISENWIHSLFPYLQQWSQEYGPVYMYSTGSKQHMYVSEPELLRELGLIKSLDLGRPSYLAGAFQPLLGDGIIRANGNNWAYQRKLIAPEFFLNKVKNMVGVIEQSTIVMMKTWENRILESEGGVADMIIDEDLKSLSADIISRACFGSSYSQGNQIFSKIASLQDALSKPSVLFGLFNFRFLPTKSNREIWRLKKEVDTLILKVVKDCQKENQKGTIPKKNLLQMMLESAVASDDKVPRRFKTDRFIVDLCKNIYFAGHETTALAASWILMLLALHPEWQECVRTEIHEVCGEQLSNHFQDMEAFRKLKMLTMVIQESIRLYGSAVVMSREAFADIKLGEFVVPKGVHMWFFIPALHRDPENWGLDALEFKLERFAQGISKACKYPQAYLPFGYGSRLCIGQTFAMLELKVVLSLILSKFSFSLSPEYRHSPVFKMLLMPQHGVRLLLTKLQGSLG